MKFAVCMPVFGQNDLTDRIVDDILGQDDGVKIYVVDNGGQYRRSDSRLQILRPGHNLGWGRGTNLAWEAALASPEGFDCFVLLNNDVVLSRDFFLHIRRTLERTGADLVGPCSDDRFCSAQSRTAQDAKTYRPRERFLPAGHLDGTCLIVPRRTAERHGTLDTDYFGLLGWGLDIDYCFRVRKGGGQVVVSELLYLNHFRQVTARQLIPEYEAVASSEMYTCLTERYGRFWVFRTSTAFGKKIRIALKCIFYARALRRFKPVIDFYKREQMGRS